MSITGTTKMSSKGQVVIPEQIRKELKLREGSLFVVVGDGDTILLKNITPPSLEDLDDLLVEARRQARRAGLKKTDIKRIVNRVRGSR